MTVRIVLADSRRSSREALSLALQRADFDLVGLARDGAEALRLTREKRPDVLTLDLDTPQVDVPAAVAEIARCGLPTKVTLLGSFESDEEVLESFQTGVQACVQKACANRDLVAAIAQLVRGNCYLSPGAARLAVDRFTPEPDADETCFTEVETEILRQIAWDVPKVEIANHLDLSSTSIKRHYHDIKEKLEAAHVGSLIRYAVRHKLAPLA